MFFRRKKVIPPTLEQLLEAARAQGFAIEGWRLAKHGCAAVIEPAAEGVARFVQMPGILIDGEIARLVDKGYQKFLTTSSGVRPALAGQLKAVHQFSEELRRVFRMTSLYNESLGTVSDRYIYDRLEGRE